MTKNGIHFNSFTKAELSQCQRKLYYVRRYILCNPYEFAKNNNIEDTSFQRITWIQLLRLSKNI